MFNRLKIWSNRGIVLFLLALSGFVFAEGSLSSANLSPAHFAFSAVLTDSDNSLREVLIPKHVMENVQRADLGDLRVFNAEGQLVPHEFVTQKAVDTSSEKQLVFYPFNQQQAADTANIRIQILQNKGKQSIDIQSDQGNRYKNSSAISNEYQYIIENPQRNQKLCKIKLSWQQQSNSLIIPLRLEISDDLQRWSSLSHASTISKLDYAGSQLIRPDIEFSCTKSKFLRLTWLKPEQNIRLKAISARYQQSGGISYQQINLGKPKQVKDKSWLFETGRLGVLSKIKLSADYEGFLYKGRLYSRVDNTSKWQFQTRFTQYRLKVNQYLFVIVSILIGK